MCLQPPLVARKSTRQGPASKREIQRRDGDEIIIKISIVVPTIFECLIWVMHCAQHFIYILI